jgi:hypothetical protein
MGQLAAAPRNNVQVQMRYCLASCLAEIEADAEAVGANGFG